MRTEDDLRDAFRNVSAGDEVDVAAGRAGVQRRVRRHQFQRVALVAALVALVVGLVPVLLRDRGQEVEMQPVQKPLSDMARACLSGVVQEVIAEGDAADGHWVLGLHRAGYFTIHVAPDDAASCPAGTRSASSDMNGYKIALDEGQDHPYQDGPIVLGSVAKSADRVRVVLWTGITRDVAPIVTPSRFEANVFLLFPRSPSERVGVAKVAAYDGRRKLGERQLEDYLECADDERGVMPYREEVTAPSEQGVIDEALRRWYSHTDGVEVDGKPASGGFSPGGGTAEFRRDGKMVGESWLSYDGEGTWKIEMQVRCAPRSGS